MKNSYIFYGVSNINYCRKNSIDSCHAEGFVLANRKFTSVEKIHHFCKHCMHKWCHSIDWWHHRQTRYRKVGFKLKYFFGLYTVSKKSFMKVKRVVNQYLTKYPSPKRLDNILRFWLKKKKRIEVYSGWIYMFGDM